MGVHEHSEGQWIGHASPAKPARVQMSRRRRIWEVNGHWQCSLIGTCLTLDELRSVARKLGYRTEPENDTDYKLHSHFVQEASSRSAAGKLLTKLLNRKYASVIKRYDRLRGDELEGAWVKDSETGDIAGPYWAVMTHPEVTDTLARRSYGEVHMLSHLAGRSARVELVAQQRMVQRIAVLEERIGNDNRRHSDRLQKKERTIQKLRSEVVAIHARIKNSDQTKVPPRGTEIRSKENSAPNSRKVEGLRQQLSGAVEENERLRTQNNALVSRVRVVETEVHVLEQALDSRSVSGRNEMPFDFDGRRILYVGGRARHVCRLRELVATWNGDLVHHDGGLEKSLDLLARAVARADAVVFPTDCVSHSAALKVKRLCHQTMKPYVPLRTSGVASFVAALRDCLIEPTVVQKTIESV